MDFRTGWLGAVAVWLLPCNGVIALPERYVIAAFDGTLDFLELVDRW